MRAKTIKCLLDNIRVNLHDLRFISGSLDWYQVYKQKNKKSINCISPKFKKMPQRTLSKHKMGENICKSYSCKVLVTKMYTILQYNNKQTNNQLKDRGKDV